MRRPSGALLLAAALAFTAASCGPSAPPRPAPAPAPTPRSPEPEGTDLVLRKRAEGVSFYALGTEPFWGLDFHPRRGWVLREMDAPDRSWPASEPTRAKSDGELSVSAERDGLRLRARLVPADCRDAMSGARFTHRVEVALVSDSGTERRLEGCGRFTAEP